VGGTQNLQWEAALDAEAAWSPAPGPLLIVSPHPDDEILAAGGLIRIWSERGHEVVILSVTDGEAAHPNWAGLGLLRRRELDQALATLCTHPPKVVRLSLPDGDVAAWMKELIYALQELCTAGPTLIAPFEADGHPDHEAVAAACLRVADELELPIARYLIWAWHHAQPTAFHGARWGKFALPALTLAAKRAAVNCFRSQLQPGDHLQPIVPPHVLEYFNREYEAFLL
jgi:LmbE family N-acetylglucosaminyl deacetylase